MKPRWEREREREREAEGSPRFDERGNRVEVRGEREKDVRYSSGDKHKGGWEGASERAAIRGGPSYIDFCPRHPTPSCLRSHPSRATLTHSRARRQRQPQQVWGVGHGGETVCDRYGREETECRAALAVSKGQSVKGRDEDGTREKERERERERILLAALSTREALGGGTLSHSTPDHRRQSPFLLSLSLSIQITGSEGRERERERERDGGDGGTRQARSARAG